MLEIHGTRLNYYETLYFDTPDFELYRQHHNGPGSRYKVRAREYVDSDVAFFEIKRKTNQGRTVKSRFQMSIITNRIDGQANAFVASHSPFNANDLEPKLWYRFLRITLVSKHNTERLTLDLNLEFDWEDACVALPGVAVAEVKQERASIRSDFIQQMRRSSIRPGSCEIVCRRAWWCHFRKQHRRRRNCDHYSPSGSA